jgi:hypothetical protein
VNAKITAHGMTRLAGTALLGLAVILPPATLVARGVPDAYRQYADGFIRGFWLLKGFLAAGGLIAILMPGALTRLFERESVAHGVPPPALARSEWLFLAALTVTAALLRAFGAARSLTFDEGFLVRALITQNPIRILFHPSGSAHVLHSLLANGAVRLCGVSEWSVRLPALAMGVLAPAALYLALRRRLARPAAALTALMLAFSPLHVWFSQEAKGNTAIVLLAVVAWWALFRLAERWRGTDAVLCTAALAGAGLAHLSGILYVAAQAVVFLLPLGFRGERSADAALRRRVLGLHGVALGWILVVYAPVLPFVLGKSRSITRVEGAATFGPLLRDLVLQFSGLDAPAGLAIAPAILAVCGLACFWTRHRELAGLLGIPLLLGLAVTVALRLFSYPRYHMFCLPGWLALAAGGAWSLWQTTGRWMAGGQDEGLARRCAARPGAAAAAGLLALTAAADGLGLREYYRFPKSTCKAVAAAERAEPADVVYVVGRDKAGYPAAGLMFYTDRFETDLTVAAALAGMPDECRVDVVALDPLAVRCRYPALAGFAEQRAARTLRLRCLGELDQYRVRESMMYSVTAGELKAFLAEHPFR